MQLRGVFEGEKCHFLQFFIEFLTRRQNNRYILPILTLERHQTNGDYLRYSALGLYKTFTVPCRLLPT